MEDAEVAVIGGGITGLATAHYLAERDVEYRLFESSEQPGGVVRSKEVDGRVLDLGPQRTRLTPRVEAMVDDLGLHDRLLTAPDGLTLYVYSDGELRVAPTTPVEALRSSLLSPPAKLRMAFEPFASLRDHDPDTAEEFMRRRFGDEAYEKMLGPLYGGIYASDPGEMPFERSVGRLLQERGIDGSLMLWAARKAAGGGEAPEAASFEHGMQELPRAIADAYEEVHLDCAVDAVTPEEDGDGYSVEHQEGSQVFEDVVVATAADSAADVVATVSRGSSEALSKLDYNELVVVHLECEAYVEGFGFQTAFDEELDILGATFQEPTFGREGLYTCYLGGGRRREVLAREDGELGRLAAEELEEVLGEPAEPLHVHRVEMPSYDRSWRHMEDVELPDDVHLVGSYVSRPGLPGRLREAESVADEISEGR